MTDILHYSLFALGEVFIIMYNHYPYKIRGF